jgi:hypothetical protein
MLRSDSSDPADGPLTDRSFARADDLCDLLKAQTFETMQMQHLPIFLLQSSHDRAHRSFPLTFGLVLYDLDLHRSGAGNAEPTRTSHRLSLQIGRDAQDPRLRRRTARIVMTQPV